MTLCVSGVVETIAHIIQCDDTSFTVIIINIILYGFIYFVLLFIFTNMFLLPL